LDLFVSNGNPEMNNKMASYTTGQEAFEIKTFHPLSALVLLWRYIAVGRLWFVLHYWATLPRIVKQIKEKGSVGDEHVWDMPFQCVRPGFNKMVPAVPYIAFFLMFSRRECCRPGILRYLRKDLHGHKSHRT
jgi:hypothetical protein